MTNISEISSFADFSLDISEDLDYTISYDEFKSNSFKIFENIVRQRFSGHPGKQKVHIHTDRITGACPYCGDSMQNDYKHRGNIILKGKFAGYFKCFNCGTFKDINSFLRDYNITPDLEFINYIASTKTDFKRTSYGTYDISVLFNTHAIDEFAIDRADIKKRYDLIEVANTPIISWLRNRLQFEDERFLYNPKFKFLIILNLTKKGKVLGFQKRNFDKRFEKYNTYNLTKIYSEMAIIDKEIPPDIDALSQIYKITEIDFSRPITLFEGPLDAFLFTNSVANAGAAKSFPLDIPIRYWYDADKMGRSKSIEKIGQGSDVFLWEKIASSLNLPYREKWDLSDLKIWAKENNIKLPNFNNYFSSDPLDAIDI